MSTITLQHGTFKPKKTVVIFYDGRALAENGLVTIPSDRTNWIKSAFYDGYNITPDGRRIWNTMQLDREIEKQTTESAVKGKNESSNRRRQPAS